MPCILSVSFTSTAVFAVCVRIFSFQQIKSRFHVISLLRDSLCSKQLRWFDSRESDGRQLQSYKARLVRWCMAIWVHSILCLELLRNHLHMCQRYSAYSCYWLHLDYQLPLWCAWFHSQSYLCNAKYCQLQTVVMFCDVIFLFPIFVVGASEKHQNGTTQLQA